VLADAPRHALLLLGPNGPFFRRLADDLEAGGTRVTKVVFNSGDSLFWHRPAVRFREPLDRWPARFRELVTEGDIDTVFLFGDGRPIHAQIMPIAEELGVAVWVFEEGYLRPDYITLERGGVNGNSSLPKDPAFYRATAGLLPPLDDASPVGQTFRWSALWTILNACANTWFGWRYPDYVHHRDINCWRQGLLWGRSGVRKVTNRIRERKVLDRLAGELSGRYFFAPLQVHCDSQVGHSRFASVSEFIREIAETFAASAPAETHLVFKHHPHDRAYTDYRALISELAAEHRLGDRLIYVHDLHLPTILRNARGTIAMNSTVGISSLLHDTPVIALGDAIYDIPGVTHQGSLGDFLVDPGEVDGELFEAFRAWVRHTTQINGSFHKRLAGSTSATGLIPGALPIGAATTPAAPRAVVIDPPSRPSAARV
jgi:capsule polysaccharide modification protein KpsS